MPLSGLQLLEVEQDVAAAEQASERASTEANKARSLLQQALIATDVASTSLIVAAGASAAMSSVSHRSTMFALLQRVEQKIAHAQQDSVHAQALVRTDMANHRGHPKHRCPSAAPRFGMFGKVNLVDAGGFNPR